MPIIHSTEALQDMAIRLRERYPDIDVILIKNSVMVYAFDSSARAIYRCDYPKERPRNRINVAAAGIDKLITRLQARGLEVGLCDLDAPPKDYAGRNPHEGMAFYAADATKEA